MPNPGRTAPAEDLSVTWCNSSAAMTGIMEAISFVTPVMEKFVIATIAEGIAGEANSPLGARCRQFVREESNHSRVHKEFNASLLDYLGMHPPGLAAVQALLNGARKHLGHSSRLQVVAALEHFAAVLSKGYLKQEGGWHFRSAAARELFARHAREELAHRCVAFDLWSSHGPTGSAGRAVTLLAIVLSGLIYVCVAVPWIIHRKTGGRLGTTLKAVATGAWKACSNSASYSTLGELFSFARRDYHPDRLMDEPGDDEPK
jgi:predicted metal-dependent hydrolase